MKRAAGTLLYRRTEAGWEVLLVHASGWYNRGKPWSIPKGELDEGESLETTARRETREETGVEAGDLYLVGEVKYKKSGKVITAFAGKAPDEANPTCASWEVDEACFVPFPEARKRLHPDQAPLLDALEAHLKSVAT